MRSQRLLQFVRHKWLFEFGDLESKYFGGEIRHVSASWEVRGIGVEKWGNMGRGVGVAVRGGGIMGKGINDGGGEARKVGGSGERGVAP